jgi:15-cis-phytoene synthase
MVRLELKEPVVQCDFSGDFAAASDFAVCRGIQRRYGPAYYFATRRFRAKVRMQTHALYAFVRVPDEWVDNPGQLSIDQRAELLRDWRSQFLRGLDGVRPHHPVLRSFCDVVRQINMPLEEPLLFLESMEQDLFVGRYPTYESLREYMRGSAVAVGFMMCHVLGVRRTAEVDLAAASLGEAMQLSNFIRDLADDARRGRIYLPLEDLESFGVAEDDILAGRMTDRIRSLLQFQIARARALYAVADNGMCALPKESQGAVRLARLLYARILDKVEDQEYDVFRAHIRTTMWDKASAAFAVWFR